MNHRVNGELLKALREEKMVERGELGKKTGLSYSTIAQLETNPERCAKTSTIRKLAKALDVRPADLIIRRSVAVKLPESHGDNAGRTMVGV